MVRGFSTKNPPVSLLHTFYWRLAPVTNCTYASHLVGLLTRLILQWRRLKTILTLSMPQYLIEFCKVSLIFKSVDEILWYHHSNESCTVLAHGAIYFSKFHKIKFGNLVEICFWLNLAVNGLINHFLWAFLGTSFTWPWAARNQQLIFYWKLRWSQSKNKKYKRYLCFRRLKRLKSCGSISKHVKVRCWRWSHGSRPAVRINLIVYQTPLF